MECPTCASLRRPLVERRSIAVLLPLLALWWLWRRLQAWARQPPVLASLTAASAVTVAGLVLVPPLVTPTRAPAGADHDHPAAPAAASGGSGAAGRPGRVAVPGAVRVRSGQRASFTGRLVPNPPGSAQRVGMAPSEGGALAQRQGHHVEVAYADITLEP